MADRQFQGLTRVQLAGIAWNMRGIMDILNSGPDLDVSFHLVWFYRELENFTTMFNSQEDVETLRLQLCVVYQEMHGFISVGGDEVSSTVQS